MTTFTEQTQAIEIARLRAVLQRLINPDDLGHAVSSEVRRLARQALGIAPSTSQSSSIDAKDSW